MTATIIGADVNGGTDYALFGTLQNGTNLSGYVLDVANGSAGFTLQSTSTAVPEPGSVALLVGLTTVGAGLLRKRRACK